MKKNSLKRKKLKQTKGIRFFTVDCNVQSTIKGTKRAKKQKKNRKKASTNN
jgi:hypothetical protein